MFEFRIIDTADGNQIIDRKLKTAYNALTPLQMMEYMEVDETLSLIDRMERKKKMESKHRKRIVKNPLYKIAGLCGLL